MHLRPQITTQWKAPERQPQEHVVVWLMKNTMTVHKNIEEKVPNHKRAFKKLMQIESLIPKRVYHHAALKHWS